MQDPLLKIEAALDWIAMRVYPYKRVKAARVMEPVQTKAF